MPGLLGIFGPAYSIGAALLGARFAALSVDGLFPNGARTDLRLYKHSSLYLDLLFSLMTLDGVLRRLGIG